MVESASIKNEEDKRGVALVLGAGGIKGWAHVGVLKVLHQAGLPIDLIVGASAGSLIGAIYAARGDAVWTERLALSFSPQDFLHWFLHDLRLSPEGGRLGRRFWRACGRLDFQEMAIPFAALAIDLKSAWPVVLRSGNVGKAVEASIRPPIVGRPVEIDGRLLIDGGLHNTVPVAVARELGARTVISVNVGELFVLPEPLRPLSAGIGRAYRGRYAYSAAIGAQFGFLAEMFSKGSPERTLADLEIRPDITGLSGMWPWHIPTAVRRGETAARRALPAVRRLLAERAA